MDMYQQVQASKDRAEEVEFKRMLLAKIDALAKEVASLKESMGTQVKKGIADAKRPGNVIAKE